MSSPWKHYSSLNRVPGMKMWIMYAWRVVGRLCVAYISVPSKCLLSLPETAMTIIITIFIPILLSQQINLSYLKSFRWLRVRTHYISLGKKWSLFHFSLYLLQLNDLITVIFHQRTLNSHLLLCNTPLGQEVSCFCFPIWHGGKMQSWTLDFPRYSGVVVYVKVVYVHNQEIKLVNYIKLEV